LEQSNPAVEQDLDGTVLRLHILKGLGFEPVLNAKGRLEKMIVRSSSGEIFVAKQERGESDAAFSERLWTLASK